MTLDNSQNWTGRVHCVSIDPPPDTFYSAQLKWIEVSFQDSTQNTKNISPAEIATQPIIPYLLNWDKISNLYKQCHEKFRKNINQGLTGCKTNRKLQTANGAALNPLFNTWKESGTSESDQEIKVNSGKANRDPELRPEKLLMRPTISQLFHKAGL